jgi:hypothetical protein
VCSLCGSGTYSSALGATQAGTCVSCSSGTYSTTVGGTSSGTCLNCLSGSFQPITGALSSAACLACLSGTYSTQQAASVCTNCPVNSDSIILGAALLSDCQCNPGFFGWLSKPSDTCTQCPADWYCFGVTSIACPPHTHSEPQSSSLAHCRCDAGYRCTHRRDVGLEVTFNMALDAFNSQQDGIKSVLATTADVPVASVQLQSAIQRITLDPPGPPVESDM